jgi:hypothetical protein
VFLGWDLHIWGQVLVGGFNLQHSINWSRLSVQIGLGSGKIDV